MHLSFTKPQLQQLHVTDFPGKRHSRSGTGALDGQTCLGLHPSPHSQRNKVPGTRCSSQEAFQGTVSAQDGSWYPGEEQPPPLGQQLFEDRMVQAGRDHWTSSSSTSLLKQGPLEQSLRVVSRWVWNISREGDPTASLGFLFHY